MKGCRLFWLFCGFTFLSFLGNAQGEEKFPNRPIELVIPYTPGGQSDVITRVFTPKLSKLLNVPITLVNRGGAGGLKGVTYVARAKKDGYVLLSGSQGPCVAMPLMSPEATVDPLKELLPLGLSSGVGALPEGGPTLLKFTGNDNCGTMLVSPPGLTPSSTYAIQLLLVS